MQFKSDIVHGVCLHCDTGTIVDASQMEKAVVQFKSSREYKSDKQGNCNVAIGKVGVLCCRSNGGGEGKGERRQGTRVRGEREGGKRKNARDRQRGRGQG